jgi:uncharacterized protein (TIGR02231 family)
VTTEAHETTGSKPSVVDAPIVSVTVYPDLARVTRRGSVTLEPGRHRVFIEPLPLGLAADSIRVGGQGAATVLGVDAVRRSHSRPPDPNLAAAQERRRSVAGEIAALDDAATVLQRHIDFLVGLGQRSSVSLARAVASGEKDPAAVATLAAALDEQLTAVYARRREITVRQQVCVDDLAAIDRMLAQPESAVVPDRMAAAIDLAAHEAGTVQLELSYMVGGAGWKSVYDIRVDGERLALTWFGMVTQHTGEDWPEGELLLSTARPSGTATVPELDPWYLDRYQPAPAPVPYPPAMAYGSPMAAAPARPPVSGSAPGSARAAVPAPPIREATATVERGVSASTYRTTRAVAVPADGTAHRATVAAIVLDAKLDYVTAPVTTPEAHLRATVVNRSAHTLLPGPASVFSGGMFVGRTTLDLWAPGEEVELALGVDDRIRVERTLVGRRATKATLGSTRRREVEYRTVVTNHTPGPARVTVLDQLPVSRDESIAVRELHLHPAPHDRTELGQLTWRFELPPGGVAEVLLGLRVELARGVEVAGWRE